MPITLTHLDPQGVDRTALIDFLTRNEFPYHARTRPSAKEVERRVDAGIFCDDDNDSYWIEHHDFGRIGIFRFEDLKDGNPMFDLRLGSRFRGQGFGGQALLAATDLLFSTMPIVTRFEGQTRVDNIAMRKSFVSCGWMKEAHYREAWPVEGKENVATVGYSILRRDWESGRLTTFEWDDLNIPASNTDRIVVTSSDEVSWRAVRGGTVPEVVEHILSTVPEWFGQPDSNAEYIEAAKTMDTWTARTEDESVIGVTLVDHHFPESAEIHFTAVDRAHHGRGVGTSMMIAIETDLRQRGVQLLTVKTLGPSHSDPGYALTRKFYRKLGFIPLEETTLWGERTPCLIMVKPLDTETAGL